LGIFQVDLQIRNTIKFGETFKAIDFDYAFQVKCIKEDSSAAFNSTREILKYWLEKSEHSSETII
jgi:hypothetical protein